MIRPEMDEDHEAIHLIVASAFGSDVEARLVEHIRASPQYVPGTALIAEIDGQIVGHVMISGATLRSDVGERPIAMLSPLAVTPDHQPMGIGQRLAREVAAAADRRGEPLVVLEGDPRYYRKVGFEPASALGIELPLPVWAPSEAAQVTRLSSFDSDDASLRAGSSTHPRSTAWTELHR